MAAAGLALFLFEAAAGTAVLLLFFPPRILGKGFFSLHGTLAFFFLLLASLLRPVGQSAAVAAATTVLAGVYALIAHLGRPRLARVILAIVAAGSVWNLVRVASTAPGGSGDMWTVSSAVLGGLLMGCALLTMNLGHWYLVSRYLPFELLSRGAVLFAVLAGARTLLLAAALAADPDRSRLEALLSLERDGLFFLFRVLWGIVGPLALSYFIWKTADMKSNQAATGLLYVALLFVLIGELLSSYLTVATGFPA